MDRRGASILFNFELFSVACFTGPNLVELGRVKINH
jgi:hypothetical protein